MRLQKKALRSLRLNYKWRGVYVWLKGRQCCRVCGGRGKAAPSGAMLAVADFPDCFHCEANGSLTGYQRIALEPKVVIQEQHAIAEGVMG